MGYLAFFGWLAPIIQSKLTIHSKCSVHPVALLQCGERAFDFQTTFSDVYLTG
ncbi:hypothetical protein NEIMUCOT_04046 [Neisseria mucosa ATCC 25996]|uniref:Uncharacterized protein n=1 Tax=Neisseria mucosa (strain ATCC 25996 / DSM 4631 / NCTC 10774 / M26) TaxID=546266 RepID=D2ZTV9_NEIM2|nr:hypothetical protein NEIMUCOT_04046 [Neisseria mucosa ATCC 25996]